MKPLAIHLQAASVVVCSMLVACASLLGLRAAPADAFPHRKHVLSGVSCAQCHAHVARSDADSPLDLPGTAVCTGCHQTPHDRRACSGCHGRAQDRQSVADAKAHLRFSHRRHAGSSQGRCTRCHERVGTDDGPLRPSMATCLSCHEHQQAWNSRACSPCHVRMEAEGTRPASHVVHGPDFMARHRMEAASARDLCNTCHRDSDCAQCHGTHVPMLPAAWHFEDVHRPDMHAQGFFARHSIEARIDPSMCATCHRDQATCRSCHERTGLTNSQPFERSPHPPGWVGTRSSENRHGVEARHNPLSCASCHGGAGEALCVGCHRVGGPGGSPHPPAFHSDKPLSELPCRLCHTGVM